jgi:hypothetical protein
MLEGWELGAITVGVVLVAALLAVPRAAPPGLFPVPLVDVVEATTTRQRFTVLADAAERDGLPFETRAVGDGLRRLGAAVASGQGDAEHLHRLIEERVQAALAAQQLPALARLRAVQARLFVKAVRRHAWGTAPARELAELGGDFVARATRNEWAGPHGCIASDDELTALFTLRWAELTHLRELPGFKPTLGELRRYYRFLLLFPERGKEDEKPARQRVGMRLRYVEALARRDTEYPILLARGSLLAELGMMPDSARALGQHLAKPRAEWNLRARNYLLFAAESGETSDTGELPAEGP